MSRNNPKGASLPAHMHENPLPLVPQRSPNRSMISPPQRRSPVNNPRSLEFRVTFSGSQENQGMRRTSPRFENRQSSGRAENGESSGEEITQEDLRRSPRRRRNRRQHRSKVFANRSYSRGSGYSSSHGSRSQDRTASFRGRRPNSFGSPRRSPRGSPSGGSRGTSSSRSPFSGSQASPNHGLSGSPQRSPWRSPRRSPTGRSEQGSRGSPNGSSRSSPRRNRRRPTKESILSEVPSEFMRIWRYLADNEKYELIHFKAIIQGYSSKVYERLACQGFKIMPKENFQRMIENHIETMSVLDKYKCSPNEPFFVGACNAVRNTEGKIEKIWINYGIPGVLLNLYFSLNGKYASEFLPRIIIEMMCEQYTTEFGRDNVDPKQLHQYLEETVQTQINHSKEQRERKKRGRRGNVFDRMIKISNQSEELRGKTVPVPELPAELRWILAIYNEKNDSYKLATLRKVIYGYWLQKFCEVNSLSCPPMNQERFDKEIDAYISAANAKNDQDAKNGIKWKDMLAKSSFLKEVPRYILELNIFMDEIFLPYSYHLRNVVLELMWEIHEASNGEGPRDMAIFNKIYASSLKKQQERREDIAQGRMMPRPPSGTQQSPAQNAQSSPTQGL